MNKFLNSRQFRNTDFKTQKFTDDTLVPLLATFSSECTGCENIRFLGTYLSDRKIVP